MPRATGNLTDEDATYLWNILLVLLLLLQVLYRFNFHRSYLIEWHVFINHSYLDHISTCPTKASIITTLFDAWG